MDDAEIRAKLKPGSSYTDLPGLHVTINQIVARNLAYFRKVAGLTQEELGERLGWSKVVVSAAERSWDGKRVRQFTVDDVVVIALTLDVPLAALFLPPEDDGVEHRYLFHVPDGVSNGGEVCHIMHDLFVYLMSEPSDDDTPPMNAYRQRYVGAVNAYLDAGRGEEVAQYLQDLTTEERIVERLARLRSQYEALRGMLTDVDQLQEALTDRLIEVRGRPLAREDKRTPEQREWEAQVNEILKELFGQSKSVTGDQLHQAIAEAIRRGIVPPSKPLDLGEADGKQESP